MSVFVCFFSWLKGTGKINGSGSPSSVGKLQIHSGATGTAAGRESWRMKLASVWNKNIQSGIKSGEIFKITGVIFEMCSKCCRAGLSSSNYAT